MKDLGEVLVFSLSNLKPEPYWKEDKQRKMMWTLLNNFHSCMCPEGLTCWTEGGKKDRIVQKQRKIRWKKRFLKRQDVQE